VLTWFHRGLPIGYGDSGVFQFFLHPTYLLDLYRWAWNPDALGGYAAPQQLTLLPVTALFSVLSWLGLSLGASQAAWYWLIEFSAMTTMYLLLLRLGGLEPRWRMASFVGAVLYAFNPLTMTVYWYAGFQGVSVILFLPMVLLLLDHSPQLSTAHLALLTAAVLFINSSAFENPAFGVPIVALGTVFLVVRLNWKQWRSLSKTLLRISVGVALGTAANAWWILPLVRGAAGYYANVAALEDPTSTLEMSSSETSLLSVLRLLPYTSGAPLWAYKNPTWRFAYDRWYMWVITGLLWIIVLIALSRPSRPRLRWLFLLVSAASVLLLLGIGPPVGGLYLWLFNHVAYFHAFRFPSSKFALVLAFGSAGLIALGLEALIPLRLLGRERTSVGWIVILISLALLCGIYVFPMWTGVVANGPITIRGVPVTAEISVPGEYETLAAFLRRRAGAYELIALPLRQGTYVTLQWAAGYDGPDPTWLLLEHPSLSYFAAGVQSMDALQTAASESSTSEVVRVAGMMGARYVLLQADAISALGSATVTPTSDLLGSTTEELRRLGAKEVFHLGKLTLYEVPGKLRRVMVYAPQDVRIVPSWHQWISEGIAANSFDGDAILAADSKQASALLSTGGTSPPVLRVSQDNPTRWVINVRAAQRSFMVALNQSFDPGWKATIEPAASAQQPDTVGSVVAHVRVNDFANGWIISPSTSGGDRDFRIVLEYEPQRVVLLGEWISGGALAGTLALLAFARFRLWLPWPGWKHRNSRGRRGS
jgi:hypothetical protein